MKIIFVTRIDLYDDNLIRTILKKAVEKEDKVQIHYKDYNEATWTIPRIISQKVIENILTDNSINKIKIVKGEE